MGHTHRYRLAFKKKKRVPVLSLASGKPVRIRQSGRTGNRGVTLWAYRTTQKSTTRETPFALAFGTEAVAPVEVGIKSPRIKFVSVEHNDEALRLNLELLDEKRKQVLRRTEEYQRKTARYYNQKVRPRSYMSGDLVLKKLLPARKNPAHGKLGPNWEGPYIISRVVRPSNHELQMEEGKILQHTWNAEHLKRFYQ